MQYNQSWFENMWTNGQNAVLHELWQKELDNTSHFWVFPEADFSKRKSYTKFRKTIAVEKPLAVVSTRLSTGNSHRTFSKVFESVTQPFQLLLAASSFGQFFKNFLGIKTFFIISRAFHITRKLWRKTGLTIVVSLYTHICYPAEYHAKFLTVEH